MRHLMIDVETLSLQHNAGIWQIGICELFNAALQAEFTCSPAKCHRDMLLSFAQWIKNLNLQSHDFKVWTKGPQFDIVKLEYHFDVYGIKCPWKYSQIMDFRTIEYLSGKRCTVPKSEAHGGLADAKYQARFMEEFLIQFQEDTGRQLYEFTVD